MLFTFIVWLVQMKMVNNKTWVELCLIIGSKNLRQISQLCVYNMHLSRLTFY